MVPDAGRLEAGLGRGACYTQWVKDKSGYEMPALPGYNAGCWEAHQRCWMPDRKRVLFFQGGVTFMYDPEKRVFENTGISFGKAPPDVMLGSMAWDPVGKRAILFGGGYIQAYCARPGDIKQDRPPDCWTPDRWDRRGTWAYDPARNEWSKLETASKDVAAANARLMDAGRDMRALWGATRGMAFEYGDLIFGKKPAELAALVEKFAAELAAFAKEIGGKGAGDYERWQFSTAAGLIEKDICAKLAEAAEALRVEDGWKALRALDEAEKKLVEAQETLAVAPRPRHYARLVTDPENRVMTLWGGDGEDRFLADTWLLHLDTNRWERCRVVSHPPHVGSSMISMDYDFANKVVVLAHQDGSVWTFDAARRTWTRLEIGASDKARGGTFRSLEYDPSAGAHVLVVMAGNGKAPRKSLLLRLDLKSARVAGAPAGGADEVWRPQYGAGSE
ncbi:MAG: hypothetical protein N2439_15635, partial [Anaerolineae bacterium]|nr:hypothetical protein [Anaerolineae bacterium]